MSNYKRIMAVVDLSAASTPIIHRTLQLARQHQAQPFVLSIIDYIPGVEDDQVPFLTPRQFREKTLQLQTERLNQLLARLGAINMEPWVIASNSLTEAFLQAINGWQPNLVVVGSQGSYRLSEHGLSLLATDDQPFDWLTVKIQPTSGWLRPFWKQRTV